MRYDLTVVPYHQLVQAGGSDPSRWMLVLHGIYGAGANWRTFARKLTEAQPDLGCVLVDLRKHGRSQEAAPPHTVAAAAADLIELEGALAVQRRPVVAVCGHSFGGKVALQYAADRGSILESAWILDASPSPRPGAFDDPDNTVADVLRLLESLPRQYSTRDDFVARIVEAGHPKMLGTWLAMNLEPEDRHYDLRLDLTAIRALLADYYATDLWPVVEAPPTDLHFVAAGRSTALSADDRARLRALASDRVHLHEIPTASHWLHIDSLPQLLSLFGDTHAPKNSAP